MLSFLDNDVVESSGVIQTELDFIMAYQLHIKSVTSFRRGSEIGMRYKENREWMGCCQLVLWHLSFWGRVSWNL